MSDPDRLARAGRFRDELEARLAASTPPYRDGSVAGDGDALHDLGVLQWRCARFEEAAHTLERALAERRARLGEHHLDTLATRERLAAVAHYQLHDTRADALFTDVIARLEEHAGPRHLRTGVARRNHAAYLRDVGDPRARETLDQATRTIVAAVGRGAPDHVAAVKVEALLLVTLGDHRGGRTLAQDALELATQAHGAAHPFTGAAALTLAFAEILLGNAAAAAAIASRARESLEPAYGSHPLLGLALDREAHARLLLDDLDGALDTHRRGAAIYARFYPTLLPYSIGDLCHALIDAGRLDDVIEVTRAALARPLGAWEREYAQEMLGAALDWIEAAR